jgi:replicative DNA helicase
MQHDDSGLILPPHSIEAEQSVLGGLLIDNAAIDRMGDLDAAAFFSMAHRLIYTAIRNQAARGKSWDSITTAEVLQENKKLDDSGGLQYIGKLAQDVPSSANIKRYADIVRENCTRRQIMSAAAELMAMVSSKGDVAVAMDSAQSKLQAITDGVQTDEPKSIRDIVAEHFNTLEQRLQNERKGITTGLSDLDDILNGGWQRGQSIVIAGRPGHGKSAFSLHNALSAAQDGYGVLYLSMEMISGELADRALAQLGRISLGNLLTGKLTESDWSGTTAATGMMHEMPLHILDKSGLSYFQAATFARRHKRKHGLDVLVLDYLQLMAGENDEKRHAQIEEITRGIKSLAKELNCAIVLLSQLSRKTDNARRPKLSDLRDSSSVEQDADVVIFIHREECDDPETQWKGYADIHVAKNRQGALGRVGATYIGHQVRFENFSGALPDWDKKENKKRGFDDGKSRSAGNQY